MKSSLDSSGTPAPRLAAFVAPARRRRLHSDRITRQKGVRLAGALLFAVATAGSAAVLAQSKAQPPAQKLDAEYTEKIKKATPDPRILTELVDHMPASDKVPSPLKVLGYIPGEPNQMTYYKDIVRYLTALDKASDRVTMFKIGVSDEGRDMFAIAVADEATIKQIDKYRQITAQLTDPRKLTDAQAKQLIATGKPIYFATGAIHSPEVGSPEMLMELAFRLAVEETPFIQTIRNNSIVVINPASEVDGREKQVDNFMATKAGKPSPSMVYWGKYVQHDNNRDGIGVGLRLTQPTDRPSVRMMRMEDLAAAVNQTPLGRIAHVAPRNRRGNITEGIGAVGHRFIFKMEIFLLKREVIDPERLAAIIECACRGTIGVGVRVPLRDHLAAPVQRAERLIPDLMVENGIFPEVGDVRIRDHHLPAAFSFLAGDRVDVRRSQGSGQLMSLE